ncbi:RNA-directed DNA polymerase (Reverse transcriptase) [Trifolium medium]|uniref:RNA-directed DNA polymerase (Reverse transcriptase) n=1 Tax=Trifolium medium TaxID=97028 RepID=A0A392MH60_9FABA|nr:RNA-directed DNA polymerase (Reverse transcriptase) [Trifolium medium]
MDKLSHLILHAVEEGKWNGIKAGRNGPVVSHLMFADDLLLFGEANEKQMHCVIDTLNQFCGMSGQEVSRDKTSILFSRNVERSMRSRLLHISSYKETNRFGNYLGVPLTGGAPKRSDFQYILDQVSSKLSAWKANTLSFAGRVTLAKSVIEAVPIYPMMSSKIPKSCLDDIQRMQRQFIWGDTDQKKKLHAIAWDKITVPKWMGGLGIRKLEIMNQACLSKLNWKLNSGSEEFWCTVMHGKYADQGSSSIKATDSSLRKALFKIEPMLHQFSVWTVGDGEDIDAWSQVWIEEGLRLDQQLNIPSHMVGLKVRELVDDNGGWNWSLLESWMPYEYQQKIAAIYPPSHENGRDIRAGVGGNSNGFAVASMYNNLCGYLHKDNSTMWCRLWKMKTPERVRAFMWMAMHNRLITNSLKSKMGLCHVMCSHCGDVEETTLHVLRDCPKAMNVWVQVIPVQSRGLFFMGETQHCNVSLSMELEE